MHWLRVEPTTLIRDYGAWIAPRMLTNHRVIGLLGLAEKPYIPITDSAAWLLKHTDGRLLQILASTPREIALVNHPEFQIDSEQMAAIHRQFPGGWVLTCHDEQCTSWEASGKILGWKDIPLLCTWLYQVTPERLRHKPLPPNLRFERLPHYSRVIGRYMANFMLDALQHRIEDEELKARFDRQEFFGLYEGAQLLSIAAITRRLFHGRCLSYVYTPNRLRGHDYAGLTVEHLCRHIFQDSAMQVVFLYADQSNPYSNRLYQKLGFELVCVSKTF